MSPEAKIVEPRVLKGFRDSLPQTAIPRQRMIRSLESVFSLFGFVPIDTPALEYTEILLGKGSDETDKQLYRFTDNGGRDVALRFDLTVPLARFSAMHADELGVPFRRYHIAPVWRAEKPQRGRYREFIQCDFDIIGTESMIADAEIVATINACLRSINIDHKVRINNRKILNGLLEIVGGKERSTAVLRAIDKLEKLGRDTVDAELREQAGLDENQRDAVFTYLEFGRAQLSRIELLKELGNFLKESPLGLAGVKELSTTCNLTASYGLDETQVEIDLSIARGLDYYTGTVFETVLVALPEIGSICSGGRYDNLASLYTKRQLPGVGGSIGLDRILGGLEALSQLKPQLSTASAMVTALDESSLPRAIEILSSLRAADIAAEVYPGITSLKNQLKYASQKQIPVVIIIGERELQSASCAVKDMRTGEQKEGVSFGEAAKEVKALLILNRASS